jgi:hypothetical protein
VLRHVKLLVLAAFAVVSTNTHWARVVDYGPFSLCVILKEGLCPSIRDINRLMMMMFPLKRSGAEACQHPMVTLYFVTSSTLGTWNDPLFGGKSPLLSSGNAT